MPLGLEPEALTYLLEGRLYLPAHNEPRDDLFRIGGKVGAQQSLGLELAPRIAYQYPTQGHGG